MWRARPGRDHPASDSGSHSEGPLAAGPFFSFRGKALPASCRYGQRLSCRGLTAIILRRGEFWSGEPAAWLAAPFYWSSWMTRPSMPPATVTTCPVTWPESSSEARTTTCRATSSGIRDLAQGHRPRDLPHGRRVDVPARHRCLGPARRDRVHPRPRRNPHDLVLQAQEQAAENRGLGRRVVRVPCLAHEARCRADEHQRAMPVSLHLAQEAARGQERRGQVLAHRVLPAFERQLPDREILRGPHTGDRCADVDAPERGARFCEQPVDLVLVGQIGLHAPVRRRARRPRRAPVPRRGGSGRRRARPRLRTLAHRRRRCRRMRR